MDTLKILNPVKTVQTGAGPVTVREMPWRDAIGFLAELSKQAGRLVTADGRLSLSIDQLPAIVQEAAGLCDFLLTHSSGLTREQADALRPVDALAVLDAAIGLNVTPELWASGKALAGRVKSVFGRPTGDGSTTSSPTNATT